MALASLQVSSLLKLNANKSEVSLLLALIARLCAQNQKNPE